MEPDGCFLTGSSRRLNWSRPTALARSTSTASASSLKTLRRYLLKLTPIEGKDLLPHVKNAYCTLVLLDKDMREIKGEKRRTPVSKSPSNHPMWSPLKSAVLRSMESTVESHQPVGIGVAAAAEEYTFGTNVNLRKAKYVLVKCKEKGQVQTEDLGRLLLALDDLDTAGIERHAWYDLQLHAGMKRVQGRIRLACRIVREPSRKQLWLAAEHMRQEIVVKDHYLYLKLHPHSFSGKAAVEWLLCHGLNRPMHGGITCSTEEEAILVGMCFLRAGIIQPVSGAATFHNSTWKYYRFGVHHLDPLVQQDKQHECDLFISDQPVAEVEYEDEELAALPLPTPPPTSRQAAAKGEKSLSIADFELIRLLGTGTFGRVVSAKHKRDGRLYAIKIVHKFGMDDNMKRNLKIERDVLREVRHPFVASLHFAFQNEDKLYMGMEYLNGGDLRYHLQLSLRDTNGLMPHRRVQLYAAELVAALAHLHSINIIYRDLKPENILVASDGHLKLVDFGLSKVLSTSAADGRKSKTLAGSPAYIAPEVLAASTLKDVSYSSACDWWSLGIVLYELYVGNTPFEDENQAIMFRNIAEGALYVPDELGAPTVSLLEGLICRDVSTRLGATESIPFSIMRHAYFEGIDWDKLQAKAYAPQWTPDRDEVYVDDEFSTEVPVDTPEWRMLDEVDREAERVADFTYRPTEIMFGP
ncbi:AGC protein kinase [Saprolegnia parasitica CBS 223.65]|uniref:AGC protein kinase n=1 Tax=Saprolegnia parasitica (strain CBS 223.65) TaxID=695850 RepID=A0A067C348_SAPPC|nr:AGC protein kinase [Saprolegnia parasitica CBS 223.65]KDO24963.1 AGC protein kinase [Saprolegnia parasitica CBS 223.65]|eukprot:XP_012204422.1 AGC protein kinase [Saprolegnia parasitica CBS 223.65]